MRAVAAAALARARAKRLTCLRVRADVQRLGGRGAARRTCTSLAFAPAPTTTAAVSATPASSAVAGHRRGHTVAGSCAGAAISCRGTAGANDARTGAVDRDQQQPESGTAARALGSRRRCQRGRRAGCGTSRQRGGERARALHRVVWAMRPPPLRARACCAWCACADDRRQTAVTVAAAAHLRPQRPLARAAQTARRYEAKLRGVERALAELAAHNRTLKRALGGGGHGPPAREPVEERLAWHEAAAGGCVGGADGRKATRCSVRRACRACRACRARCSCVRTNNLPLTAFATALDAIVSAARRPAPSNHNGASRAI